ncbi:XRE family transcriptional regulator [Lacticaseibacillus chiayiensis]|uniref:Helix-turn-helix domain-containing protein n=1 Tax=Lacticaseibacillus chiayiensis TaxID=2100821 RepID=A0A4Q1TMJ3_9LACO|nr:Rgg/GadR/MutR family transcriptional regulator [Lacticaseibacillus chiayiensis]QVI34173.1 helix-turn-helix domain-containing protein [Lacticaseibacillus chiayiensis]RXT19493.1 XRE family transcriptional regulator [Lacticaseibacillus chiayiensis]RXT57894.1 XRE family transcriptional regulator [Lacticaseibacillus chiayiensis]UYN55954.1 helix-turn-helix domain-containing protein [Lacticaseibacillus chiayiensis]
MSLRDAGSTFKQIRLGRGLRISDVAGPLSVSTVSKFENGHTDISVEKLYLLLDHVGMDATEFFEILNLNQARNASPASLSQRAMDKRMFRYALEQDVDGLKQFRQSFTSKFQKTHARLYKLREIMVSAIILDTQDVHSLLSKTDSKIVNDYLMKRNVWYALEYALYGDCVPFLQPDDFDRLYTKFMAIHFDFHQRRNYLDLFFSAFYNVSVSLYYRCEYAKALQTLNRLEEQKLPDNLFFLRVQLRLLKLLCTYKITGDQADINELNALVKVISKISPAFGRKWKVDFSFQEPITDKH